MPNLESPNTYAEWYWRNSVDAIRSRAEEIEKDLSPFAAGFIDSVLDIQGIPLEVLSYLQALKTPPKPSLDNPIIAFLGAAGSKITDFVFNGKMREADYGLNSKLQNLRITSDVANTLWLRKRITEDFWLQRSQDAGFSPEEADHNFNATVPYPSIDDVIRWARYNGAPDFPKDKVLERYNVPDNEWTLWEWLSIQRLNTEQVMRLWQEGWWDDTKAQTEYSKLGWQSDNFFALSQLAYQVPNSMLLVQAGLHRDLEQSKITELIQRGGIHPSYAEAYFDGVTTKPSSQEIIEYTLRNDPNLGGLNTSLRRIGIHPDYHDLYRTLAHPIPPIQDIITMAVREAFTPSIAQRFGQYEGLPEEFLEWSERKGLTREWASRYWAAHWNLPSPQQGFEMLHRGIIGIDDLQLLLKALDIMPFWRDKLIQMSYRPLTRVDVRRMYGLGVLNEQQVIQAYRELGYNDANARRSADFAIRYTKQSISRFTSNDVINAYTKRFIDRGQAASLLQQTGITGNAIGEVLQKADYKRQWAEQQQQTDAVENLYKKGKLSDDETRIRLSQLNYPADHVETLLQQWQAKAAGDKIATWTVAQTLSFLKKGLISPDRAKVELDLIGYTPERIDIYIRSIVEQTA